MRSQCGPPQFDEQDFSKFDFSRWHLDGLTLDPVSTALGGLTEKLFTSDEWRKHFEATLPQFQSRSVDFFKQQLKDLQKERADTATDFENRAKTAEQVSADFRKSLAVTAAPVALDAVPNVFQGSVRVVSEKDPQLGLPGVRVQVLDPKDEKTVLLESISDLNGNVVLPFPPEIAKDRNERDMNLQVVDAAGKTIAKFAEAICIRIGQTEERVVKIPESAAIDENKKQALATRSDRETRASQLAARADTLRRDSKDVLAVFDCRIKDTEEVLAALQKPAPTRAPASPAPAAPQKAAAPEPTPAAAEEKESPRSTRKRRKKKG